MSVCCFSFLSLQPNAGTGQAGQGWGVSPTPPHHPLTKSPGIHAGRTGDQTETAPSWNRSFFASIRPILDPPPKISSMPCMAYALHGMQQSYTYIDIAVQRHHVATAGIQLQEGLPFIFLLFLGRRDRETKYLPPTTHHYHYLIPWGMFQEMDQIGREGEEDQEERRRLRFLCLQRERCQARR